MEKYRSKTNLYFFYLILFLIAGAFYGVKLYNELSDDQKVRIDQTITILTQAKFDRETTTLRSDIWKIALEKAKESPIIGWGYNSFNYFKEEGQGVHNMYLKVFGESGIIVLCFYLVIIFVIYFGLLRLKNHYIGYTFLMTFSILLIFNASNHNAFENFIISAILGIIFGVLSRTKNEIFSI